MGTRLAHIKDLQEDIGLRVELADGRNIAVFKHRDEFFAMDDLCPHAGGSLSEGTIDGSDVVCPWHGWQFDIRSGQCQNIPGVDIHMYRIERKGDELFLAE